MRVTLAVDGLNERFKAQEMNFLHFCFKQSISDVLHSDSFKNFIEISRKSSAMNFFVCKFSTLLRMVYCVFYEVF